MEDQILKKDAKEAKRFREWHYGKDGVAKPYCYTIPILMDFLGIESFAIYLYITRFVQMNGWSYVKYDEISKRLHISKTTINKILISLRGMGILIKHFKGGGNNFYYTISTDAVDMIVMTINRFGNIEPDRLKKELEGVNLSAVNFEYVERLIKKNIPEARCDDTSISDNEQDNFA